MLFRALIVSLGYLCCDWSPFFFSLKSADVRGAGTRDEPPKNVFVGGYRKTSETTSLNILFGYLINIILILRQGH